MKKLLILSLLVVFSSCSRQTWHAPMAMPTDTVPLLIPQMQAKKITITGPVTFTVQNGAGNTSTATATDNTKAGQRATSAAIGAGSTATATKQGTPWYVYALVVVLLVGVGCWINAQFPTLFSFLR